MVKPALQRSTAFAARLLKKAIKTQIGKHIAFHMGLKGFDRISYRLLNFRRKHSGEPLGKNEILINHTENPNIPVGESWVYRKPGCFSFAYNSRVNVGARLQCYLMSNNNALSPTLTSPTFPNYIALSVSSITPASGDTTLAGETSASGLARALGTIQNYVAPTAVDAAASYDIYKQFTNTSAGAVTVVSSALFDASTTGNMFAEVQFGTNATLQVNDILQVTWTVSI